MASLLLANVINKLHFVLVLTVLLGCFAPIRYLPYYILFILLILFDWNDFDGMCSLTKLEHWARNDNWEARSPQEGGPGFVRSLLNNTFNLNLTAIQADKINTIVFVFGLLIAFLRLAIHYRMF